MSREALPTIRSDPGFLAYSAFGVDWSDLLVRAIHEPYSDVPEEYLTTLHFLIARATAILRIEKDPLPDEWLMEVGEWVRQGIREGIRMELRKGPPNIDDPRRRDRVLTLASVVQAGTDRAGLTAKRSSVYAALSLGLYRIAVDAIEDPVQFSGLNSWELLVGAADALGRAHGAAQSILASSKPRTRKHPELYSEAMKYVATTDTARHVARRLINRDWSLVEKAYPGREAADVEDTLASQIGRWFRESGLRKKKKTR